MQLLLSAAAAFLCARARAMALLQGVADDDGCTDGWSKEKSEYTTCCGELSESIRLFK